MRRELSRVAAALTLLLSALGLLAAGTPAKPELTPAVAPGPISAALCGRKSGQRLHAEALDRLDPTIPPIWRKVKIADFELWLKAPICLDATPTEVARFERRRGALGQLRSQIEWAHTTELVEAALARFRGWQLGSDEWPTSSECSGCAALRKAAVRVAAVTASRWPERTQVEEVRIGPRLDAASKREPLIAALCAVKPLPGARAEIEGRFRYYSWTVSGARLFEVAALFEQPEIVAGCQGR